MTEEQARAARAAWFGRYPAVWWWQRRNYDRARATGLLRTVLGRPLRAEWERGEIKYTLACNFPIQGSAADVMLLAVPRVVRALAGRDAHPILQVHDELVIECAEAEADRVAAALDEHMTAAFSELFPGAPTSGLVSVGTARCWGNAK
jgi:DNA polymerase-1